MATATSVLGVGMGAPLVQKGSEVDVANEYWIGIGKTLNVKGGDRAPRITTLRELTCVLEKIYYLI